MGAASLGWVRGSWRRYGEGPPGPTSLPSPAKMDKAGLTPWGAQRDQVTCQDWTAGWLARLGQVWDLWARLGHVSYLRLLNARRAQSSSRRSLRRGDRPRSVASVPVTAPSLWGFLSDYWTFPPRGPQPAVEVDLPSSVQSQNACAGGVSVLNEHQSWKVAMEIPIL